MRASIPEGMLRDAGLDRERGETGWNTGVNTRPEYGRQKDKNPVKSGANLGLSVEREITPGSPSFHFYQGNGEAFFCKKEEVLELAGFGSQQSDHRKY